MMYWPLGGGKGYRYNFMRPHRNVKIICGISPLVTQQNLSTQKPTFLKKDMGLILAAEDYLAQDC